MKVQLINLCHEIQNLGSLGTYFTEIYSSI